MMLQVAWRAGHHIRFRGFQWQRDRRQQVGAEVDKQYCQCAHRQRNCSHYVHHHRCHLRNVACQRVRDQFLQIVKDQTTWHNQPASISETLLERNQFSESETGFSFAKSIMLLTLLTIISVNTAERECVTHQFNTSVNLNHIEKKQPSSPTHLPSSYTIGQTKCRKKLYPSKRTRKCCTK